MRKLRSILIISIVVSLAFGVSIYHIAHAAGPTGMYDILTFPGATTTDCGTWEVTSTNGVDQPGPSDYVETMTDGNGVVVFSRSQAGGVGTFMSWGSGSFTTPPTANPIHEHIVMDGVVIADIFADNPCLPPSVFQGVPIPEGFVLRTITCDTPVYDAAGGMPLGTGEAVTNGQTWFVSPTPTAVGGTNWTEIFNNGLKDGFIPTSCVGGVPAGYTGE